MVRECLNLNCHKGPQWVCWLLHPVCPVILTAVQYFLTFHWRKGWTTVLIVNSRSKRKKSRKSFSLSARKAVAMYCCHGVGERESSNPTPVHEEKCTSEERTKRANRGFTPWECWSLLGGRQEGKLSKVARAGSVGKGKR